MQAYAESTAKAYDRIWRGYGESFARNVLQHWPGADPPGAVLDLGCGTGSSVSVFLDHGLRVLAVDASPHMLACAKASCQGHVAAGTASFLQADIRDFRIDCLVDLAVSAYDTINHLESLADLGRCFRCVIRALRPGGTFLFDLNTVRGLDDWNRVKITDRSDHAVVSRGFFDPAQGRAWKKFSGFFEVETGRYERFEEVIFNTAFQLDDVVGELARAGFEEVRLSSLSDPTAALADPESEDRVLIVGSRPRNGAVAEP